MSSCRFGGRLVKLIPAFARTQRADVSDWRMESVRVVEPFDAIEHICLCRILRAVDFSSDALRFQRREEALDGRIVPDVSRPAHAARVRCRPSSAGTGR